MIRPALYSFADLGGIDCGVFRLRGVGLANCLFPWARCAVASRRHNLFRIASTWPQLCHKQWLRWDRDKRFYAGLFVERGLAVAGVRKLALLSTLRSIDEADFLADPLAYKCGVVVFSGIEGYFASMLDEHAYLRDLLLASTRIDRQPDLGQHPSPQIYVHVRLGDAIDPDTEAGRALPIRYHLRQPMSWFVHIVNQLREQLGSCVPVSIFSDGSDAELRSLLSLPRVARLSFGSSIADLLALSTAGLLIASSSTFSMWAAYLGRMPVIWPTGGRRQRLHGTAWEYEVENGMDPLPREVIALVKNRLVASATPVFSMQ